MTKNSISLEAEKRIMSKISKYLRHDITDNEIICLGGIVKRAVEDAYDYCGANGGKEKTKTYQPRSGTLVI